MRDEMAYHRRKQLNLSATYGQRTMFVLMSPCSRWGSCPQLGFNALILPFSSLALLCKVALLRTAGPKAKC